MNFNLTTIINPEAKIFIENFMMSRRVNRDYYALVPDDQLDFRMVDTPKTKSDTPRESLIHQIEVTRLYISAVKSGKLDFADHKSDPELMGLSKEELLNQLDHTTQELIDLLSESNINSLKVHVPWSSHPIPAIPTLYALTSHEVFHTGWNVAIMDHLGIPRFESLRSLWG